MTQSTGFTPNNHDEIVFMLHKLYNFYIFSQPHVAKFLPRLWLKRLTEVTQAGWSREGAIGSEKASRSGMNWSEDPPWKDGDGVKADGYPGVQPRLTLKTFSPLKVSRVVGFGHPESVFRPPSNRIRLDSVAYRLQFLPVRAADEGDFFCLVNDRQKPTRLTRILIKGEEGSERLKFRPFSHLDPLSLE